MSITVKTHVAWLATLLLAAVIFAGTIAGGTSVNRSNTRVTGAIDELVAHDAVDNLIRELRIDLGNATRAVEAGQAADPRQWQEVDARLAALEQELARHGETEMAIAGQDVSRAARQMAVDGKAGVVAKPAIMRFVGALRAFDTARDRADGRTAGAMAGEIGKGFESTSLWMAGLAVAAGIGAALQLAFGLWLRRSIVAPVRRMSDALLGAAPETIANDADRSDEIGALARAALACREDASAQREVAEQLDRLVRLDALTGLLGRQAFDTSLREMLERASPGDEIALLTLDLDRFKDINDTEGHAAGDAVLKTVASLLQRICVDGETVGRLGGDEFAIIQPFKSQPGDARALSNRLLDAFNDEGIGVSIGVALYPGDAVEESRLRHYSDLALYRAKHDGRARARFFSTTRTASSSGPTGYVPLPSELSAAIAADELRLHYQPKMRARTGKIDSLEALVRWQHPSRGLVTPDSFIPIAEKMGQIRALTEWTLKRAVADQASLAAAGHELPIYVNLSACLLGDPRFMHGALKIVEKRVGMIGLEVTETGVIDDPEHALAHLQNFVDAGLRVAIDDYGVGMSSLTYLKRLPAHELKIDRAFVAELSRSHRDPLIVRSTIDLAHALGLEVTAEGVEKLSAFALLRAMGCDLIQGYLVARPMPLDRLLPFLTNGEALSHLSNAEGEVRAASGLAVR